MPHQFFLYLTPGKPIILLKGILPIVKFITFCKPHVHGCITSNRNLHPLHSCLSAIFQIPLELTSFYCTQWYTVMDFDCICLSIHIMIKWHVHVQSFLLKVLWKFWTCRSLYTQERVLQRKLRYSIPAFPGITGQFIWLATNPFSIRKSDLCITWEVTILAVFFSIMVSSALFALAFLSHESSQPATSSESVVQLVFLCSATFSISFSTELSFQDQ